MQVTEQANASWVIGADGAHSTVRKLVGTKLAGSFVGERFLLGTSTPSTHST
ncbi:FAD-dependent monooxygenase [Mycobacterium heidelbergense]|uniref:FAD-dependent monooxygenase n=1 Tax=Mycobacterium heidelbergense TaxID=53376 RepID=UPI0038CBF51E